VRSMRKSHPPPLTPAPTPRKKKKKKKKTHILQPPGREPSDVDSGLQGTCGAAQLA